MEKSSLIAIYRSLDKKEVRELGKWLDSPFHNQRQDVRDLHAYLLKGEHLSNDSFLTKERVWRKLFPEERFDDAKMRQVLHFSLKTVEEWMAYMHWTENTIAQRFSLVKQYRKRNLDRPLQKSLKQIEKLQASSLQKDDSFFRYEYRLQQEKYALQTVGDSIKDVDLQIVATSLDQAYLIEKLRLSCLMLFHQKVYKVSYQVELLDSVVAYVEQYELTKIHSLAIYYYVLKCLQEDSEDESRYFEKLRQTVQKNGDVLPWKDAHDIYLMIINLCISKINRNQKAYGREAFEWYKMGFERDVILENNQLTRYTYLNVVSAALNLQEFEWASKFIEDYFMLLDDEVREDTYLYAKARYFYLTNNYEETMSTLVQIDIKHPVYNLLGKTMLMKIYYELGELDALESLLESMNAYIRRKDLSDQHQQNFGSIVKFTRQLSRLEPFNKKKRKALLEEVKATSPLSEKSWLVEQLG